MFCSDPSPCPFRRRRKEARPAELLEAALGLFVEKGFAATRSEEVARAAGVSKGTLYLYFPSKEELLKAVIQQYLADEISGVREAISDEGPTGQMMEQVLLDWWLRIYQGPASGVFKLVLTEVRNFPDIAQFYQERVVLPGSQLVLDLIERGIRLGEFRAVDLRAAVHSIIMPMILLCVHKHSLGACGVVKELGEDPAAFIRAHLNIVLRGLQRRPDDPPPA